MQSWLRYVSWYAVTTSNPDATIESIFEGPTVMTHWKAQKSDPELIQFDRLWKIFDLVSSIDS